MPALQYIFYSLSSLAFNNAVLDRIYEDIVEEDNFKSELLNDENIETLKFNDKITVENLSYNYPKSDKLVLKNINIEIEKNQEIAFAGATGAGKSTLVDIILGLLEPSTGYLKIDDKIVDKNIIRSWQKNIGYVPQDIFLIDDTIIKNIAFGVDKDNIDIRKVKKAAEIANIANFIENELSEGYNTIVGERGIRISGGQKQRIGLARALYHDPEVLILDEATSSLDSKTQEQVMDAINAIVEVKTMIIIAHRLSTVKNCDQIYLIEEGKIIDQGKYDELAERNQYFKRLIKLAV
jgi:ATP-binding cassette subfamily C protein